MSHIHEFVLFWSFVGIPNACMHNIRSFGQIYTTRSCSGTQACQRIEDGPSQWSMSKRDCVRSSCFTADKTSCWYLGRSELNCKCRLGCCQDGIWDRCVSQYYVPGQLHSQVRGLNMPQPQLSLPFSQILDSFAEGAILCFWEGWCFLLAERRWWHITTKTYFHCHWLWMCWNSTRRMQMRRTGGNSSVNDPT